MQLFITNINPKICAKHLDDLRLNKIIVESAQLLSTAYPELIDKPYKPTHVNHPLVKWLLKSRMHYFWTVDYLKALCDERKTRFPNCKLHKTEERFKSIQSGDWVLEEHDFHNCTPYKNLPTFEAYRKTLITKWKGDKKSPTWGGLTKVILKRSLKSNSSQQKKLGRLSKTHYLICSAF